MLTTCWRVTVRAVDKDGSGTIDMRELLTGLSTALRGDATQRAEFYFSLYDTDKSGCLEEDELYRLLVRVHQRARNRTSTLLRVAERLTTDTCRAWAVHPLILQERGQTSSTELTSGAASSLLASLGLADLDADGDGKISQAEFLEAVRNNPAVLELFGQVVH